MDEKMEEMVEERKGRSRGKKEADDRGGEGCRAVVRSMLSGSQ